MLDLNNNQKKIVVAILCIAFLLRIASIDSHGLWTDEKTSLLIANGIEFSDKTSADSLETLAQLKNKNTIKNVISACIHDNGNGVAYNLILHYWSKLFGNSDLAVRSLSLLFSMATLLAAFLFCLRNINYKTALFVLILLAIQSMSITYANEARTYAFTTFFSFGATWIFWEFILQKKTLPSLSITFLYAIFCSLSILSHYLSTYVFIGHALIALCFMRNKKQWLHFIGAGLFAITLLTYWMISGGSDGLVIMSFQNAEYSEIAKNHQVGDSNFVIPSTLFNITIGILQVWLQEFGNGLQAFFRVREISALLLLPLASIFLVFKYESEKRKLVIALCIVVLTQTLIALYMAINSGHTISFQPLYANFSAPYALILLGMGFVVLTERHPKTSLALGSVQGIICAASIYAVLLDVSKKRQENPYAVFSEKLEKNYIDNDTVLYSSPKDAQILSLYLPCEKKYSFTADSTCVDILKLKNNDAFVLDLKNKKY